MGGKPQDGESIADDVISAQPINSVPDLQLVKNELDDIVTRINTLEIMVMRVLDALELSHNVNVFVSKEKNYYGP